MIGVHYFDISRFLCNTTHYSFCQNSICDELELSHHESHECLSHLVADTSVYVIVSSVNTAASVMSFSNTLSKRTNLICSSALWAVTLSKGGSIRNADWHLALFSDIRGNDGNAMCPRWCIYFKYESPLIHYRGWTVLFHACSFLRHEVFIGMNCSTIIFNVSYDFLIVDSNGRLMAINHSLLPYLVATALVQL